MTVRARPPLMAARAIALTAGLALTAGFLLGAPAAVAQNGADAGRTVLVLDASGSMWQRIQGGHKITVAREVVGQLLDALPADRELGLWGCGPTGTRARAIAGTSRNWCRPGATIARPSVRRSSR